MKKIIIGLLLSAGLSGHAESLTLAQLPDQSTLKLTQEISIPANTDYVEFGGVICGTNEVLNTASIYCKCNLEVQPSGSARVLSIGHNIVIKKSTDDEKYIGDRYNGSDNQLEVNDGVVNQIECHSFDLEVPFSWTSTISMDGFNKIIDGIATLTLPHQ